MINLIPLNDLKTHTEDSTCECCPSVIIENGEMIIIHNSYDGRELEEKGAIQLNYDILKDGYEKGLITKQEIKELLAEAVEDEEYRVAVSIRDVLNCI